MKLRLPLQQKSDGKIERNSMGITFVGKVIKYYLLKEPFFCTQ